MQSVYFFIALIAFFVIALTLSNALQRKKGNTRERETPAPPIDLGSSNGCCGAHEVCEKDSLIAAFAEPTEYFDDEELDKYRNRESDRYTAEEADEFREVFYSVLDEEKPRWIRSLQMREIELPDQLKDEVLMIVNDLRAQNIHA
ncbi:MAG: phospholipase [Proteiniphilum sp.]|jgi:hypothetical protein|nr:phospholipase [Proteiniphilum sp.]MDD4158966.1 phospholipase [Proteiniphilum sp.]MDD4799978.1 phospholipase [Proteiniphilum sp.]